MTMSRCERTGSARLPLTVAELRNASPWKEEGEWLKKAIKRTGR